MQDQSAIDVLRESDLTESEYQELEALARRSGELVQSTLFRLRLRRVAHFLCVRTALREGATGGSYVGMASRYRDEIGVLERAQRMVGRASEAGTALVEPIAARKELLELIERLPSDARSKDEVKSAAAMLVEIFADHTSRLPSELSPGSRESPNHLCRFVRRALAIMLVHLGHDRVWQLVKETVRRGKDSPELQKRLH